MATNPNSLVLENKIAYVEIMTQTIREVLKVNDGYIKY